MESEENFAYHIGEIAGKYIKFKKDIGENNNTLQDIITYSKYDREKLRFVHRRVCLGISLTKPSSDKQNQLTEIIKFIRDVMPKDEINDSNAHKDNSYFFYKGVFEQLGK